MKEMVGGCCVCSDDRGWAENPLVYCDGQGCTVAVHQACYGIVTVPSGNWYCRKCEVPERSARTGPRQQHCELCPSKDGAIKKTDNNGWAHVVCALYIPEVRFGNVTTMEPILLQNIPTERFHKVCYICEESGKGSRSTVGACMQCNKSGCKQQFHVTCAQGLGLLCEEAGNYLDNVKYCGYCQHHYSKLKKGANVKTVPPYRPATTDSSPSPDKDTGENWSKPPGKRKLSASGKSSGSTTPLGLKSGVGGKSSGSGTTSPTPPATELPPAAALQEHTPVMPASAPPTTSSDHPTPSDTTTPVNGKFTTSNFVESVVTPSGSVFGEVGKSGKKRKSQAKDESPNQQPTTISPTNPMISVQEEKRLKVDPSAPIKVEPQTPSVVVKAPSTTLTTSPTVTPPVSRPPTTSSPIAATSSIVVSVPLAVASLPTNPVTTVPTATTITPVAEEVPSKRGRSQSTDKSDKGRKQKRGGSSVSGRRGGRNSEGTPPPLQTTQASPTPPVVTTTATSAPTPVVVPVSQVIKESPPSSPDSKQKVKKRDEKDKQLFQNGVNAPHMLGNQLNPASTMAQKMSDTLNQELEAHSIFTSEPNLSTQPGQLVGPQLHSRVIASVRGSGAGTPNTPPASGGWASNSMNSSLDQLLERQWEQGSQFLMEQAQHFDIASLLTCLHQLRGENLRLEEHVSSLRQRRDHLLAVNARLAIPLVPPTQVNNIHPAVANASVPMDGNRPVQSQAPRLNNSYPTGMENGPTSPGQPYHPSQNHPAQNHPSQNHPSQNVISRHHSPGSNNQPYVCSAPGVVVRSTHVTSAPDSRRSSSQSGSSHAQANYSSMYAVPSQQSQMRRDVSDMHHQIPSSKPS